MTLKLVAALVPPFVLSAVMVGFDPGRGSLDDKPVFLIVSYAITFLYFGGWSWLNGRYWERLSPGYRVLWRPRARATPYFLAVVFAAAGVYMLYESVRRFL